MLPSAHFYRVPLAVPYWNGATYRAILRSVLSGSVIAGLDLGKLRAAVIEMLGVGDAVLCGSGSLALELALRACGVRKDDEVVIPTLCCTAVVSPILAAGALPVLADIGEDLNITAETADAVLTRKTKAVIVPHLFGNPAEINSIVELARDKNLRVIDDAAQALGATIDGRPVGSFGDAGILSFGDEKICFGLGGGVVVYPRQEVLDRCSKIDLAPPLPSTAAGRFLSTLIWRRWRRWTFPVLKALPRMESDSPDSQPSPYRKETMANLSAAVAASLMETLRENIATRRARVHAYQELLGAEERVAVIPHRTGSACLTQVIRISQRGNSNDLAAHLIDVLASAGYEVQGSYVPIHLLPSYAPRAQKRLPHAERVWADLLELPCEPDVSFNHVERIAAIVRKVVNS